MATATLGTLIDTLRESLLLEPAQRDELVNDLQQRYREPEDLVKDLVKKGWLTSYQAEELLKGSGQGLILGQYVLLSKLGEGGMGEVFKALHRRMNREVALKVIRKEALSSPTAKKRFDREIQLAAKLSHPNVVTAHDANEVGDTIFFVMEYVEGTDLARIVKDHGPLPVPLACDYIRQAALGLQNAHECNLVHRDIKPSNLLLARQGSVVKILDMGLARALSDPDEKENLQTQLTRAGSVMGTPDFMSPEQAQDSHEVDIRSDIYSLGCSLYFLLTGQVPFPQGSLLDKLFKHRFEEPQPIEELRPDISGEVAAILRKMMAKRPEDRYQFPVDLAEALVPHCPPPGVPLPLPGLTEGQGTRVLERSLGNTNPGSGRTGAVEPGSATTAMSIVGQRPQTRTIQSGVIPRPSATRGDNPGATVVPPAATMPPSSPDLGDPHATAMPFPTREPQSTSAGRLLPSSATVHVQQGQTTMVAPSPEKNNKFLYAILAVAASALVVSVGIGLAVFFKPSGTSPATGGSASTQVEPTGTVASTTPAKTSKNGGPIISPSETADKVALLIGVQQYNEKELKDMPWAENDMRTLEQVLKETGWKTTLMTQTAGMESLIPNADNIRDELRKLLKDRKKADSVLIALAGQGVQYDEDPDAYFCPAGTKLPQKETLLKLQFVYGQLASCAAGFKLVLIDAWRPNPLADTYPNLPPKVRTHFRPQTIAPPTDTAVMFANAVGGPAHDDKEKGHGVYFYHVIQGLRQAEKAGNLEEYLRREVSQHGSRPEKEQQKPQRVGRISGSAPLPNLAMLRSLPPKLEEQGTRVEELPTGVIARVADLAGGIRHIALSGDGQRALFVTEKEVAVWNLLNRKEEDPPVARMKVPSDAAPLDVRSIALSLTGSRAIFGCPTGERIIKNQTAKPVNVIGRWDVDGGEIPALFPRYDMLNFMGHVGEVTCLALSLDGKSALSGGDDKTVRLWDVSSGTEKVQMKVNHTLRVTCVAVMEEDDVPRYGLSGGRDSTIRYWDLQTGDVIHVFKGHASFVKCLAVAPGGQFAVSGGIEREVLLWDLKGKSRVREYPKMHTDQVLAVAFHPDGNLFASGGADGTICLWDRKNPDKITEFRHPAEIKVLSLAFTADGRYLISAADDRTVRRWKLPEPKAQFKSPGSLEFSRTYANHSPRP